MTTSAQKFFALAVYHRYKKMLLVDPIVLHVRWRIVENDCVHARARLQDNCKIFRFNRPHYFPMAKFNFTSYYFALSESYCSFFI